MGRRILQIDSLSGIAGDMFTAAFLDAGLVDARKIRAVPSLLGWPDVEIKITKTNRASIQCTHLDVKSSGETWKETLKKAEVKPGAFTVIGAAPAPAAHEHGNAGHGHSHTHGHAHGGHGHSHGSRDAWHTHYVDLDALLAGSNLPDNVKNNARGIFRELAMAEADSHGLPLDQVAFHEVGTYDSICDVVMAAFCIEAVRADAVCALPVPAGRGFIRIDHGVHAVPPPATARLLRGMPVAPVPAAIQRDNIELTTPTGAAILKFLSPRFVHEWPAGVLRASGMGAGTMQFENFPNALRVALIEEGPSAGAGDSGLFETEEVLELRFAVDDMTGEQVGRFAGRLFESGALDVQIIQTISKKARPGQIFEILARPGDEARLAELVLRESSSFGVRITPKVRWKLSDSVEERSVDGKKVRYRVGRDRRGQFIKEKPEFDDLR